jgi:hypothetical protein
VPVEGLDFQILIDPCDVCGERQVLDFLLSFQPQHTQQDVAPQVSIAYSLLLRYGCFLLYLEADDLLLCPFFPVRAMVKDLLLESRDVVVKEVGQIMDLFEEGDRHSRAIVVQDDESLGLFDGVEVEVSKLLELGMSSLRQHYLNTYTHPSKSLKLSDSSLRTC